MTWYRDRVEITHEPSGLKVTSNIDRSMVKSRASCMRMIKGQLWSLEHGTDQIEPTEAQIAIAERILAKRKNK